MEDWIGVLVFVLFAVVSIAGRAMKQKQQGDNGRQQQWPGPIAGNPGRMGRPMPPPVRPLQAPPQPTSTWAPRPAAQAAPQPQAQALQPKQAPKTLVSGDVFTTSLDDTEGVGTEGPQGQMDVPDPAADVERELRTFEQESERFGRLQLTQLSNDLVRPDQRAETVTPDETAARADLQAALTDPDSLSRAIVLAEVLGKPKAMRARGRRVW